MPPSIRINANAASCKIDSTLLSSMFATKGSSHVILSSAVVDSKSSSSPVDGNINTRVPVKINNTSAPFFQDPANDDALKESQLFRLRFEPLVLLKSFSVRLVAGIIIAGWERDDVK